MAFMQNLLMHYAEKIPLVKLLSVEGDYPSGDLILNGADAEISGGGECLDLADDAL